MFNTIINSARPALLWTSATLFSFGHKKLLIFNSSFLRALRAHKSVRDLFVSAQSFVSLHSDHSSVDSAKVTILNPPKSHKKSRTIFGRGTRWPRCHVGYRAKASLCEMNVVCTRDSPTWSILTFSLGAILVSVDKTKLAKK